MTYSDLQKVNQSLNMTLIKSKKGSPKDFAKCDEKIKAFKMLYPNGGINTTILSIKDGVCVAHAEITDEHGHIIGAGTASKLQTSDNSDGYIESAETAAVGRALRFVGIGIETISKSETVITVDVELELAKCRQKIMMYAIKHKFDEDKIKAICDRYKVSDLMDLNLDCCRHYIDFIKENGGEI